MTAALIKILLTPSLIALATLLARRWGPGVGGTIAGLPLTSAPVSVFLAIEQGPAFAARAAQGTLLGLLGQAALCLAYSRVAPRTGWWPSALAGIGAFFAVTALLAHLSLSIPVALAAVSGLLILTASAIPTAIGSAPPPSPLRWDLPARMLAATAVVVTLTAVAPQLGPTWTGLLSPFPTFALVLGAFTHRTQGAAPAGRLLRGVVLGSLAHAVMFGLVAALLVERGLGWTYAWASAAALAVNALAMAVSRSGEFPRT
jgi:hypothetical protein